jgi:hypothetical protein
LGGSVLGSYSEGNYLPLEKRWSSGFSVHTSVIPLPPQAPQSRGMIRSAALPLPPHLEHSLVFNAAPQIGHVLRFPVDKNPSHALMLTPPLARCWCEIAPGLERVLHQIFGRPQSAPAGSPDPAERHWMATVGCTRSKASCCGVLILARMGPPPRRKIGCILMDTAYHTQLIFDLFSAYPPCRSFFGR